MDLIVLVADSDMNQAVKGLLSRPEALEVQPIEYEIFRHSDHDPGCRTDAHNFLRPFSRQYDHALVMLDRYGSGPDSAAGEIESEIERALAQNGWAEDAARAIVIDPELENWVWSRSPHVEEILGWRGRTPSLWDWLHQQGFLQEGRAKPDQPKQALEAALRQVAKKRLQILYRRLAERVSLQTCEDRAFGRLRSILQEWFPKEDGS